MYAKMYYEVTRPKNINMLVMTPEDKVHFSNNNICHICEKDIGKLDGNEKKVRDHCHITGKYRGPAHEFCNLNYKYPKFNPLYFHNRSGYDVHLFIKELARHDRSDMRDTPLTIIPSNEENYISFSKDFVVDNFTKNGKTIEITRTIRFLDTFRFILSSLDKLVGNLETLPMTQKWIQELVRGRMFILMNTWTHLISLKNHFHQRKNSTN